MKTLLSQMAFLLLLHVAAYADALYNVTINTSTLAGSPAGPFYLQVQLADGSGTGDGNNTAVMTNIQLGGGTVAGSPLVQGDAFGSLSSSVVLTDGSLLSYLVQPFTPGTALSFQLDLTTNVDSGGTPDGFAVSILDSTLTPIPTSAGPGFDTVVQIYINSDNPAATGSAGDANRTPVAGGAPISFSAPILQQQCASDVSSSVTVTRSGYTFNFGTQQFYQTLTLTNNSGSLISGPFAVVLDGLSSNANLFNSQGVTSCAVPLGSPYISTGAGGLAPGASASLVLQFTNPTRASITYNTRVLAGSATD